QNSFVNFFRRRLEEFQTWLTRTDRKEEQDKIIVEKIVARMVHCAEWHRHRRSLLDVCALWCSDPFASVVAPLFRRMRITSARIFLMVPVVGYHQTRVLKYVVNNLGISPDVRLGGYNSRLVREYCYWGMSEPEIKEVIECFYGCGLFQTQACIMDFEK